MPPHSFTVSYNLFVTDWEFILYYIRSLKTGLSHEVIAGPACDCSYKKVWRLFISKNAKLQQQQIWIFIS